MRRMLNALLTEKSLHALSIQRNSSLLDLLEDGRLSADIPLKNVCARVHPELADRIDAICFLLDISKRRFLEAAFIEACDQADQVIADEGLSEPCAVPAEGDQA